MQTSFRLEVATPERMLINEAVTEAYVPGADGFIGILPGHAPLLGELGFGRMDYTLVTGQKHSMVVQGGWVEVNGHHVRVLATAAELANEIDVERAQKALKRAMDRLNHRGEVDLARALNAAKRAQARLDAAKVAGKGEAPPQH